MKTTQRCQCKSEFDRDSKREFIIEYGKYTLDSLCSEEMVAAILNCEISDLKNFSGLEKICIRAVTGRCWMKGKLRNYIDVLNGRAKK